MVFNALAPQLLTSNQTKFDILAQRTFQNHTKQGVIDTLVEK